jgi:hypothetical protein
VLVTDLDGHALSELGVLKLDLLGSRALSELDEVATLTGKPLDAKENDAATLDLMRRADTVACPQLETPLVRGVLRRMPIARDEDVIAALALVRPGPGTGSSVACPSRATKTSSRRWPSCVRVQGRGRPRKRSCVVHVAKSPRGTRIRGFASASPERTACSCTRRT